MESQNSECIKNKNRLILFGFKALGKKKSQVFAS